MSWRDEVDVPKRAYSLPLFDTYLAHPRWMLVVETSSFLYETPTLYGFVSLGEEMLEAYELF